MCVPIFIRIEGKGFLFCPFIRIHLLFAICSLLPGKPEKAMRKVIKIRIEWTSYVSLIISSEPLFAKLCRKAVKTSPTAILGIPSSWRGVLSLSLSLSWLPIRSYQVPTFKNVLSFLRTNLILDRLLLMNTYKQLNNMHFVDTPTKKK